MLDKKQFERKLIVICGPTASGKTGFFERLNQASEQTFECINADTGQMYKELSIGTSKPNFSKIKNHQNYHLFDQISLGEQFSACRFRGQTERLCAQIWDRGNQPVIVGGSMFYISSLFFPQKSEIKSIKSSVELELLKKNRKDLQTSQLYDQLTQIDPKRAEKIMPNDRFRINRALEIYDQFGIIPSKLEPEFAPLAKTKLIFLCPEREILDQKIRQRLQIMLKNSTFSNQSGWIEEAQKFANDDRAVQFIANNGLIGYWEIIDWIKSGSKESELTVLEEKIFARTRDYSRRQVKFWRNLEKKIKLADQLGLVEIIHQST